jgi:Protein of unknown function (DUF3192)
MPASVPREIVREEVLPAPPRRAGLDGAGGWRHAVIPKRLLAWLLVTAGLSAVSACTGANYVLAHNREALSRLSLGMTREQVIQIMGTKDFKYVTNPYRTEAFTTPDGKHVEILYYATANRRNDAAYLGDELTPIVLEEGVVVGWGWTHVRIYADRYPPSVGAPRTR